MALAEVNVVEDVGVNEGFNKGLNSVLLAISKHGGIQAKNLSTLLNGRPIKTIERQIADLVGRGLIEGRGSRETGGYWKVSR